MRSLLAALLISGLCACASRTPPPAPGTAGRAPYDAKPEPGHSISIRLDDSAAREILAALARPAYDAAELRRLEDLTAVRLAIEDSGRSREVFDRDFAAAFDPEIRTAVFDFAAIRRERERWERLLASLPARRAEIEAKASERAAALLPADHLVQVAVNAYLTFGLAGLADHLVVRSSAEAPAIIVDLSRALGESDGEPGSQTSRLARLLAGELFRAAWARYRAANPNWTRGAARLGPLEPLVQTVAETGPVALYSIEESFFPLSTWLKEPMLRTLGDLNRMAERLIEAEQNLEARIALSAEVRRPDFTGRVAAPAGAYMADGIVQASGIQGLRSALSAGPVAFFEAYDRASRAADLPELSKVLRERLAARPSAASTVP